mmetsp:Transcript_9494/g.27762  ORF Transcript_9494/g.27762 Transcript_9494/m.27762 type:complete len:362 (+) Transcript_9494:540-1625(+)
MDVRRGRVGELARQGPPPTPLLGGGRCPRGGRHRMRLAFEASRLPGRQQGSLRHLALEHDGGVEVLLLRELVLPLDGLARVAAAAQAPHGRRRGGRVVGVGVRLGVRAHPPAVRGSGGIHDGGVQGAAAGVDCRVGEAAVGPRAGHGHHRLAGARDARRRRRIHGHAAAAGNARGPAARAPGRGDRARARRRAPARHAAGLGLMGRGPAGARLLLPLVHVPVGHAGAEAALLENDCRGVERVPVALAAVVAAVLVGVLAGRVGLVTPVVVVVVRLLVVREVPEAALDGRRLLKHEQRHAEDAQHAGVEHHDVALGVEGGHDQQGQGAGDAGAEEGEAARPLPRRAQEDVHARMHELLEGHD